jgi:hypothetical protein
MAGENEVSPVTEAVSGHEVSPARASDHPQTRRLNPIPKPYEGTPENGITLLESERRLRNIGIKTMDTSHPVPRGERQGLDPETGKLIREKVYGNDDLDSLPQDDSMHWAPPDHDE